jgi:V/A-type H+-transporting ATPase subunit C
MIEVNLAIAMYAFPRARIGAMRSLSLDREAYKLLLEAGELRDAVSLLKLSSYGEELGKLNSPTMEDVEKILQKSLLEDYKKMTTSLYGFGKVFIQKVAKKFEIHALKAALQIRISQDTTPIESHVIPFGSIDEDVIERINRSESLEEIAESLRETEYYPIVQSHLQDLREGDAFLLSTSLDKYVYDGIGEKLKAVHGLDKRVTRMLVGTEIDFKNLMVALRCRGLEEEDVDRLLINYPYNFDQAFLKGMLNDSLETLSLEGSDYASILGEAFENYRKTGSLTGLETAFQKYLLKLNITALTGFPFQLGAVIAYLNLKKVEVGNITTILKGKKEGLARKEIEDLLMIP